MIKFYIFDRFGYIRGFLYCKDFQEAKFYAKRDWAKVIRNGGYVSA